MKRLPYLACSFAVPPIIITFVLMTVPKELIMPTFLKTLTLIILVYAPIIHLLRARHLKMSWKDILISLIPLFGARTRQRLNMYNNPR